MSYSVAQAPPFTDNVIWYGSWCSIGALFTSFGVSPASAAWPTAAKAIYVPFVLQSGGTVYKVGWHNGATAAGTSEVGVYSAGGTKIISGSATQTTINVVQWVDVTDTVLAPGQYWLAAMNSGTTGTYFSQAPTNRACAQMGVLTQTSANPLPATATFARDDVLAYLPMAFLQMRATM